MPNWKKLIVSGSDAILKSLFVTNAITASIVSASQFTGSFFGTSSWASNVISSSYASSSALTLITSSTSNTNYKLVFAATTPSPDYKQLFIDSASGGIGYNPSTNRLNITNITVTDIKATTISASSGITGSLTGSLLGTASWASQALTSSYITGSTFTSANPALSASYALTASYANNLYGFVAEVTQSNTNNLFYTSGLNRTASLYTINSPVIGTRYFYNITVFWFVVANNNDTLFIQKSPNFTTIDTPNLLTNNYFNSAGQNGLAPRTYTTAGSFVATDANPILISVKMTGTSTVSDLRYVKLLLTSIGA